MFGFRISRKFKLHCMKFQMFVFNPHLFPIEMLYTWLLIENYSCHNHYLAFSVYCRMKNIPIFFHFFWSCIFIQYSQKSFQSHLRNLMIIYNILYICLYFFVFLKIFTFNIHNSQLWMISGRILWSKAFFSKHTEISSLKVTFVLLSALYPTFIHLSISFSHYLIQIHYHKDLVKLKIVFFNKIYRYSIILN